MGIAPYKYFTYDGESSRNYDVYLTGDGVFNAPERAVEMLEIPGRNGNYALDQGKFNNITVTYKAGIVDYSESNFANKVSAVRNWLCSKVGYKRLSDDYNPNEYRMAVFRSGVNIDHVDLKTGEFEITFDCKPQRWLTSGETAVTVANSGTLDNPTPFEAEPLLAVDGYGTIGFNGYEVEIENVPIGDIVIYEGGTSSSLVLDESNLNLGDTVTVNLNYIKTPIRATVTTSASLHTSVNSIADTNSGFATSYDGGMKLDSSKREFYFKTTATPFNITVGTNSTVTNTVSGTFTTKATGVSSATITFSFKQTFTYTASTHTITLTTSNKSATSTQTWIVPTVQDGTPTYSTIIGDSTKSVISDTVYIDCEIGECWTEQGGQIVNLNHVISLGSDLPKLSSGTNTFTYDNTVTQLEVQPRWWKV